MQLLVIISYRYKAKASQISEVQRECICKQTKVYDKDLKKFTQWHEKVNDAAFELALSDRNILFLPKQDLIGSSERSP